jgi:hypothetical protein
VRRFDDLGPDLASATLAKVLAAAAARGEIGACDAEAAANHFVGMIRGNVHLQVMLGLRAAPGEAERTTLVASAVGIFPDRTRPPRLTARPSTSRDHGAGNRMYERATCGQSVRSGIAAMAADPSLETARRAGKAGDPSAGKTPVPTAPHGDARRSDCWSVENGAPEGIRTPGLCLRRGY